MKQIAMLRESFTFTLLNMMHSRIEYPKGEPGKKPQKPVITVETANAAAGDAPVAQAALPPSTEALPPAPQALNITSKAATTPEAAKPANGPKNP
jgi:hypothetical protein